MWPLQKDRYKRMRQVGGYITYPLSHLCTHAHKCACVHTHTHAHILIHITHTRQPLYSVPPLYLPIQLLRVTAPSSDMVTSWFISFVIYIFLRIFCCSFYLVPLYLSYICTHTTHLFRYTESLWFLTIPITTFSWGSQWFLEYVPVKPESASGFMAHVQLWK